LAFDTAVVLPAILFVIMYWKWSYTIFNYIYSKIWTSSIISNIFDFLMNWSNIFFWAFLISLFVLLAVDVFQKLKHIWKWLVLWIAIILIDTIRFWINFFQK